MSDITPIGISNPEKSDSGKTHKELCQWCHRPARHVSVSIDQVPNYACDEHVPNRSWHQTGCQNKCCDGCSRNTVNLEHDPLCPASNEGTGMCYAAFPECQCVIITAARADERRWVLSSGGRQIRSHVVKDGVCACGVDVPDQLEHLAEIVEVYMHTLLPEHKSIDWQRDA